MNLANKHLKDYTDRLYRLGNFGWQVNDAYDARTVDLLAKVIDSAMKKRSSSSSSTLQIEQSQQCDLKSEMQTDEL